MSGWRQPLGRLFRTIPELDRADKRSGATFVNILFGLVVTQVAIQLSREVVKGWADGWATVDGTRTSHLVVAMTLTVLSWIGYHQSQQYPPFLIKFVNIPLLQFFLDVLMVVVYYVVVAMAENSDRTTGPLLSPSALPEAILVFVVFVLYSLWDWAGYRLFSDPEYSRRLENPREPDQRLGSRRWVTFIFCAMSGVLALSIWLLGLQTAQAVIIADAAIVAMLVLYRLSKQAFDPRMMTRSAATSLADMRRATTR